MTSCDDRALMHGLADPAPVPRCVTCKSTDVFYEGGNQGYCNQCEDNREMEDDTE